MSLSRTFCWHRGWGYESISNLGRFIFHTYHRRFRVSRRAQYPEDFEDRELCCFSRYRRPLHASRTRNLSSERGNTKPRKAAFVWCFQTTYLLQRRVVWTYKNGKLVGVEFESDHADIAAAFNAARSTHGFSQVRFNIVANNYGTVTTTFDFADKTTGVPVRIDLSGVSFTAETSGSPVFDCTGSHNGLYLNQTRLKVTGGSSNTPDVCWLLARGSSGSNVGNNVDVGRSGGR